MGDPKVPSECPGKPNFLAPWFGSRPQYEEKSSSLLIPWGAVGTVVPELGSPKLVEPPSASDPSNWCCEQIASARENWAFKVPITQRYKMAANNFIFLKIYF